MNTVRIDKRLSELRQAGEAVDTSEAIDLRYIMDVVKRMLGFLPHEDFVDFVATYGTMLRGGAGVSGLFADELNSCEGCVVYDTIRARVEFGLPSTLLALHIDEDGGVVCLGQDGSVFLWEQGAVSALYDTVESYILEGVLQ